MKFKEPLSEAKNDMGFTMWLKLNAKPVFFGIMFVIGVIIGASVAAWINAGEIDILSKAALSFIDQRKQQSIMQTFFSAILPNISAWLVLFICGFCAVSAPVIAMVPCVRGMGYGAFACLILAVLKEQGIKYICVYLIGNLMVSTITLIYCCCDAAYMSDYFWQAILPSSKLKNSKITAPLFCGKMLLYAVLIVAGAVIETYSYSLF